VDVSTLIAHIVWRIFVIFSRDQSTATFTHLHDVTKLYLYSLIKSSSHGVIFSPRFSVLAILMKPSKYVWKGSYVL